MTEPAPSLVCTQCRQEKPAGVMKLLLGELVCRVCFARTAVAPTVLEIGRLHRKQVRYPCPTPSAAFAIERKTQRVIRTLSALLPFEEGGPLIEELFRAAGVPPPQRVVLTRDQAIAHATGLM